MRIEIRIDIKHSRVDVRVNFCFLTSSVLMVWPKPWMRGLLASFSCQMNIWPTSFTPPSIIMFSWIWLKLQKPFANYYSIDIFSVELYIFPPRQEEMVIFETIHWRDTIVEDLFIPFQFDFLVCKMETGRTKIWYSVWISRSRRYHYFYSDYFPRLSCYYIDVSAGLLSNLPQVYIDGNF